MKTYPGNNQFSQKTPFSSKNLIKYLSLVSSSYLKYNGWPFSTKTKLHDYVDST